LQDGSVVESVEGVSSSSIVGAVKRLVSGSSTPQPTASSVASSYVSTTVTEPTESPEEAKAKLNARLQALVSKSPVMLFMKVGSFHS
jgi:hypothetical protein